MSPAQLAEIRRKQEEQRAEKEVSIISYHSLSSFTLYDGSELRVRKLGLTGSMIVEE